MSIEVAIKAAISNPISTLPKMAAVIYNKKRIVSIGLNQIKTHPLQAKYKRNEHTEFLHAEVAAIINAKCDVRGMTMYIARVDKLGKARLAKPCKGCQQALADYGITQIYWTE